MAKNSWTERFDLVAAVDFFLENFLGFFVLVANVKNAFSRSCDQARNDHALDDEMRDVLHDVPVFDRAGFAFVGIAYDVFRASGRIANNFPFSSRRKSSSAQTAQAAGLQGGDGP